MHLSVNGNQLQTIKLQKDMSKRSYIVESNRLIKINNLQNYPKFLNIHRNVHHQQAKNIIEFVINKKENDELGRTLNISLSNCYD